MADTRKHAREGFLGATLFSLNGVLLWALHLGLVYAVQHVACTTGGAAASSPALTAFILAVTGAIILLLAAVALKPGLFLSMLHGDHANDRTLTFLVSVMRLLNVLSIAGVAWAGVAPLMMAECLGLR